MNAAAQVWHVIKKDVQQSRWVYGSYVGLILALTARATRADATIGSDVEIPPYVFVMFALGVMVVLTMQNDSPADVRNDFKARPVHEWSILGAKITLVAALAGIAVVAQAGVFLFYDIDVARIPGLLSDAMPSVLFVLLTAFVLGAITPDFKSLVVALVGSFAGFVLLSEVRSGMEQPMRDFAITHGITASSGIGITLVSGVFLYYARPGMSRFVAVPIACLMLLAAFVIGDLRSVSVLKPLITPVPSSTQQAQLSIDSIRIQYEGDSSSFNPLVSIAVRATNDTGSLFLAIEHATGMITSPDGTAVRITAVSGVQLKSPIDRVLHVKRWLGTSQVSAHTLVTRISDSRLSELHFGSPGTQLSIRATVVAYEAVITTARHTGETNSFAPNGWAMPTQRSQSAALTFGGTGVWDQAISLLDEVAVVNSVRGEGTTVSVLKRQHHLTAAKLLPGAVVDSVYALVSGPSVVYASGDHAQVLLDEQWFRESNVFIVQWKPKYTYVVNTEYVVPQ